MLRKSIKDDSCCLCGHSEQKTVRTKEREKKKWSLKKKTLKQGQKSAGLPITSCSSAELSLRNPMVAMPPPQLTRNPDYFPMVSSVREIKIPVPSPRNKPTNPLPRITFAYSSVEGGERAKNDSERLKKIQSQTTLSSYADTGKQTKNQNRIEVKRAISYADSDEPSSEIINDQHLKGQVLFKLV